MKLQGKGALITGAARGIGQATAIELARVGVDILGVDLEAADFSETSESVRNLGREFHGFACDVTDELLVANLMSQLRQRGGFDILVNNAGVLASGAFADRAFDGWRTMIEINLTGLMTVTYAALPDLSSRPQAHIVNLASIAGKFGTPGLAGYAASKHGVVGFSSALREELREAGIGVSWICPTIVDTRMTRGVRSHVLTPRIQPEAVARAIRRAIKKNSGEVFVPWWMRLSSSILPALAPGLARWLSRTTGVYQSWLEVQKTPEFSKPSDDRKSVPI